MNHILDRFCGCVEEKELETVIRDILRLVHKQPPGPFPECFKRTVIENPGIAYLTLTFLEEMGLIQHGIAIRYPIITDKGKEYLEQLEEKYK